MSLYDGSMICNSTIKRDGPTAYPSLICADLCNLERDVQVFAEIGYQALHIDLVDGYFSPSMPMGLEVLRQLRKKTSLPFYAHLMAQKPDFFMNELLDIGVSRLCVQIETIEHVDRYLNVIRSRGVKAGLALNPGTSLRVLDYVAEKCDFILLMLINPGYAHLNNENQVPYALKKIKDLRVLLDQQKMDIPIEVDGRIALNDISRFHAAGADSFIVGSTCLYLNGDLKSGKLEIDRVIAAVSQGNRQELKI
jgi:ribulose-phosphate 3-epimerase